MKQYLIADSGGSKTDWCFIDACKTKTCFTTKSYHPSNCNALFIHSEITFWASRAHMMGAKILFFGAGCLNEKGRDQLDTTLREIGFQNVTVKSDLHGAGLALFGDKEGCGAILGTGSVLFNWKDHKVLNVIGGKGHLIGDEGSGFYFGKLIFEAFQENRLTDKQRVVFESVANISRINSAIEKNTQKFILGELSLKLREDRLLFNDFHVRNATLFCEKHLDSTAAKNISIVGGYGYHHREVFRTVLNGFNHDAIRFLKKPIEAIVDQILVFNE